MWPWLWKTPCRKWDVPVDCSNCVDQAGLQPALSQASGIRPLPVCVLLLHLALLLPCGSSAPPPCPSLLRTHLTPGPEALLLSFHTKVKGSPPQPTPPRRRGLLSDSRAPHLSYSCFILNCLLQILTQCLLRMRSCTNSLWASDSPL